MFSSPHLKKIKPRPPHFSRSLLSCFSLILCPLLAEETALDPTELTVVKKIHAKITKKTVNAPGQTYELSIPETRLKLTMHPIPAGKTLMKGVLEEDQYTAELEAFWMCETEIPWDFYDIFMAPKHLRNKEGLPKDSESVTNEDLIIAQPSPPYHAMSFGMGVRKHPAIAMTQHGANKFCQWLSWKTGHFYRLPTEAEWEYAARAGVSTKFPWGNEEDEAQADLHAWHNDNASGSYKRIGKKKANAWGLKDMSGNVMEWTLDQYVPNRRKALGGAETYKNPWIKATKPYPHVCKGGHWMEGIEQLSFSSQLLSSPAWKASDPQTPKSIWYHTNIMWIGFRPIRTVKTPTIEEMYAYWNSGVAYD